LTHHGKLAATSAPTAENYPSVRHTCARHTAFSSWRWRDSGDEHRCPPTRFRAAFHPYLSRGGPASWNL